MDSLTQALLGSATFALGADDELGKKSLLIGALAGTIPDLDFLLAPLFGDIEFLTVHRSVTHSLLFCVLASVLFGYALHHIFRRRYQLHRWIWAFFLAFTTHALLDMCTSYGTKLLSPFDDHLFSTHNIHVFEPVYTLILLLGMALVMWTKKSVAYQKRVICYTLLLSSLYMAWTFGAKHMASRAFIAQLEAQDLDYQKLLVTPTPLNSLLWYGIAKSDQGYHIGTYSLMDRGEGIDFYFEKSDFHLIDQIKDNKRVKYYLDYTQGFPLIQRKSNDEVLIYAIKYGAINFTGPPEFVYPLKLSLNNLSDEAIGIDKSGPNRGPVKDMTELWNRILSRR